MKKVLSGVQPSGSPHLGNYLGAMKQNVELPSKHECAIFIADMHALTTVKDPKELHEMTINLALDYLALGLDPVTAIAMASLHTAQHYRRPDLGAIAPGLYLFSSESSSPPVRLSQIPHDTPSMKRLTAWVSWRTASLAGIGLDHPLCDLALDDSDGHVLTERRDAQADLRVCRGQRLSQCDGAHTGVFAPL